MEMLEVRIGLRSNGAHEDNDAHFAELPSLLTTRTSARLAAILAGAVFMLVLDNVSATADGGGGGSATTGVPVGTAGGPGFDGQAGVNGGGAPFAGGAGGGGGGAGGGLGGAGGFDSFTLATGGAGGNGGANGNGAGSGVINNGGLFSGANGTDGASTTDFRSGGGGGGAGGYGAIVTGSSSNINSGTISGGRGGNGGSSQDASGGSGGDGGIGLFFSLSGTTLLNSGSISGGAGGAKGISTGGVPDGLNGTGGAGIVGADLSITNSGTISGGLAGDGVTRANAITFTGGANSLTLLSGSTITGNVVGTRQDTFQLGGAANASFDVSQIGAAAQYRGFGTFNKIGASTWTLTGTNIALDWTVQQGALIVSGAIGAATVNNGSYLLGTGTVGNTLIASGASFVPGTAYMPGTSMTVNGSLTLQSAAVYVVQVSPATSSFANVTGTATLGGATVAAYFVSGSYIAKRYTILTAGNVSGTFAPTVTNTYLPAGFQTSLSYDTTHAYLDLALSFVPPSFVPQTFRVPSGLSGNQQGVGNALINYFNSTGGIPMVFGSLTPNGLTQISGETTTGSQQTSFNAMTQFVTFMTDPFNGGRTTSPGATPFADDGALAYAGAPRTARDAYAAIYRKAPTAYEPRWSVWASGFGGSQTTNGNIAAGTSNSASSIAAGAVGADCRFSPDTVAGFALAGGGTSFSVVNGGSGRSDLFQAGAFVRHTQGAAYVLAAAAYGWQDITTDRTVTVAGLDRLHAEFDANTYSGRLEGGYRFLSPYTGGIGFTPYTAVQSTTFDLPAYAESGTVGSNVFALAYGKQSITDVRSELGLRTDKSFALTFAVLTLRGRAAWAHDFNPDRAASATFQTLPGASFVVNGATPARDSALTTAAAEMNWMNGWSTSATFEGEFSEVTRSYAGKGVVRYSW
jgi:uncharacterized protein with beta-barrel porin domain